MKISIWIRPHKSEGKVIMVRTDVKYESNDTPLIQHRGKQLLDALEGGFGVDKEEGN